MKVNVQSGPFGSLGRFLRSKSILEMGGNVTVNNINVLNSFSVVQSDAPV